MLVSLSACGEDGNCFVSAPSSNSVTTGTKQTVTVSFDSNGTPGLLDFHGGYWSVEDSVPTDVGPVNTDLTVEVTLVDDGVPDKVGDETIEVEFPSGESIQTAERIFCG